MTEFLVPVDIGNRALQHIGGGRITAFTDSNRRASEVNFAYGKLRRAELRRNTWRFATRRTAIRPVDVTTFLLAPTLYSASATYFVGSVVEDASGTYWISRNADNTNNEPGVASAWEPYFGPVTVHPYDSGTSYYSGELVYTNTGNGKYNVYLSKITGNTVHPALPSQWVGTTTYNKNDVVQEFAAWAGGTTYSKGAGVTYSGNVYASLTNANVGNTPSTSTTNWALMSPLTLADDATPPSTTPIDEWKQATTYAQSDFVVFNCSVYLSLLASNTGQFPNAAASTYWVAVTGGTLYMSAFDLNLGNDPATTSYAAWASGATYASGAKATGSDGLIYTSQVNSNVGNDPTTDSGANWVSTGTLNPWSHSFTQGGGNGLWTQIGGDSFPSGVGLTRLNILYPVNSGPASQRSTRNVYRLPAGFLKKAPQDPKAGSTSQMGAPTNLTYDDWVFFGEYLVTSDSTPILLRFVADVQDVSTFDDMFCEGLACRIGLEVCETLTQSTAKLQSIASQYQKFMGEARLTNAIDQGSDESPLDDYLACRA